MISNGDKRLITWCAAVFATLLLAGCDNGGSSDVAANEPGSDKPNILFVMMDDVGIDQMTSFGYGGANAPRMPHMDAVAQAGVRFRNTWAQPECSPARAGFFAGRYPTRTHIYQAIGENDLANAQLSPYEVTTPKLLKQAGYQSAMFGKFHLAGPHNNPAEYNTPGVLGWDYFYGWIDGMPPAIDTTAGGLSSHTNTAYSCGFVPKSESNQGACFYSPDSNRPAVAAPLDPASKDAAGLQCVTSGGLFVPGASPADARPAFLNFDIDQYNAYYVSPLLIVDHGQITRDPRVDPPIRGYRTTIETNAAIDWIKSRPSGQPWMATVSYTSAHTPWQSPPGGLTSEPATPVDGTDCVGLPRGRMIQNRMTEAMDTEFGRLLVETGLASYQADGSLHYDPKASNTMIVIIGDNGTLGQAVKNPFDVSRAKGTAYQTGVWVPLIVAGPLVAEPGSKINHMVNGVDLFQLFGELAGIDVHQAVPRTLDSVGLRDYLVNPAQPAMRTVNFAISGLNQQVGDQRNSPCVVDPGLQADGSTTTTDFAGKTCMQVATNKHICEDNMGIWWGPDHDTLTDLAGYAPSVARYNTCAEVNKDLYAANQGGPHAGELYTTFPDQSVALRNHDYKLVRNTFLLFDPAQPDPVTKNTEEFYPVNEAEAPHGQIGALMLDTVDNNLFDANGGFKAAPSQEAVAAYEQLESKLNAMMVASLDCPGDGNIDGQVNHIDIDIWSQLSQHWGQSSLYDFTGFSAPDGSQLPDGLTNSLDYALISAQQSKPCPPTYGIY